MRFPVVASIVATLWVGSFLAAQDIVVDVESPIVRRLPPIDAAYHSQELAKCLQVNPANRVYVRQGDTIYPVLGIADYSGDLLTSDAVADCLESEAGLRVAIPEGVRSDVRVYRAGSADWVRTVDLLPAPRFANDLFCPLTDSDSKRLGDAVLLSTTGKSIPEKSILARIRAMPSFGVAFDTNAPGSFNVPGIPLGSPASAGQSTFTGTGELEDVPILVLADAQLLNASRFGLPEQQVQILVEGHNYVAKWPSAILRQSAIGA